MPELELADERPLWRRIVDYPLVALLIAAFALLLAAGLAAALVEAAMPASSDRTILSDIAAVLAMVVVYKLLIRHLGERKRDDLSGPHAVRQTLLGLSIGFILFSAIVGVAALAGVYRIVGMGDLSFLANALVTDGLFPAISEELMFRGILFRWIEAWGGSWVALIVTSALFGASHLFNPHAGDVAAIGIALEAGLMLGAAYMLTRRLWVPMGIHAAWNVTQGEIFDIPVSGTPVHAMVDSRLQGPPLLTGSGFGLEASLIAISIATLFGIFLVVLAVRRGEVIAPRWVRRRREASIR